MKTLVKTMAVVVFTLALANCGKKGGGGGAPAADVATNQVTQGATEIKFDSNTGTVVLWSQNRNNIYINDTSSCYYGYPTNADDNVASKRISTLSELINTSTIGKGSQNSSNPNSIYLTVRYDNEVRTFNLNNDLASTNEETLSRGGEIIAFFTQARGEIDDYNYRTCDYGKNKGDNYSSNNSNY